MKRFKEFSKDHKSKNTPTYHDVYVGKHIDLEDEKNYHNVFIGKIKKDKIDLDEAVDFKDVPIDSEKETETHEKLKGHYKFDNPDHVNAIGRYTGPGYRTINKALYKGEKMSSNDQKTTNDLSSSLRTHKTPHDIVVHSGIKRSPGNLPADNDGVIRMNMPAFTSTSLSSKMAETFSDLDVKKAGEAEAHHLHIHIPAGSHGAYVDHHSSAEGEKEFVLHPNAKLEVHPTPEIREEKPDYAAGISKIRNYHWRARLVHDGVKEVG
jgi:hypothetical protein